MAGPIARAKEARHWPSPLTAPRWWSRALLLIMIMMAVKDRQLSTLFITAQAISSDHRVQ
jgi:hypothetical protein